MIIFAVVWAVGAIVTFLVTVGLMWVVTNYGLVAFWSIMAWPIYLPLMIISALMGD